ncbi:MAG TPA: mechanosensitive ion channel domain-containing protein [Opitutaceae bacterium]|nr:mechanosensitive ion channel domain-containing protein [Opitutaceae bacterium]
MIPSPRIFFVLNALLFALATVTRAAAASAPAALPAPLAVPKQVAPAKSEGVNSEVLTAEAVTARRIELAREIAALRQEFLRLPEANGDDVTSRFSQEFALLDRLDRIYAEQLATLQHSADLAKEFAEIEARTRNRQEPGASLRPPFGLELLDRLYDECGYLTHAEDWLKTDIANATEALADARENAEEKERARRAAREGVQKADAGTGAPGRLRRAELESRLALETVRLREQAVRTLKFQAAILAPKLALVKPDLDWLLRHLVFAPQEAAAAAERREKRSGALKKAVADAKTGVEKISRLIAAAERGGEATARELELRRSDRQSANDTVIFFSSQLERLDEFETVAEQRRRVLGTPPARAEIVTWRDANRAALLQLEKLRRQRLAEIAQAQQELQELPDRLAKLTPAEGGLKTPLADRERMLRAWLQAAEADRSDLDGMRTARLRLQEEIGRRVTTFSLPDSGRAFRDGVVAAWNYELFSVQDQPVRVKTVLTVAGLLALGFALARWLSALVGRLVFRRFGLRTGRSAAWQTLFYYGLCLVIVLTAFSAFHLSLTQFSVVSGALAVGLGFGSQALISNFISGLILLIERPVSTGDVITLDGQELTVERIGPRSTIVRSPDNTHLIVPNSHLLDRSVINWTLSDDVVRRKIKLGIAHGADTREVDRLLVEIMTGHPSVLQDPPARVLFLEIDDSALRFEAVFYAHLEDKVDVLTELRHRMVDALAKAKIAVAAPRREVQLKNDLSPQIPSVAPVAPPPPSR